MSRNMPLFMAALKYIEGGLSIVVVNRFKEAIHPWTLYNTQIISSSDLFALLQRKDAYGIAVIGGAVSGNFETFDIDLKNDLSGSLMKQLKSKIDNLIPQLQEKLPLVQTPSEGFHFYYRLMEESNSRILAKRAPTELELLKSKICPVLIETRSKGHYAIVPPTPGYTFLHGSLPNVPILSTQEQEVLWNCGLSFNEVKEVTKAPPIKEAARSLIGSPFEDYDNRGDVLGLLVKHGWKIIPNSQDQLRIYLQRPGITHNRTSANFHLQLNLFKVFSTSTPFIRGEAYKPYAVYAVLECDSDFRLAAKRLIADGFGISYKELRRMARI
jgi:hypothetical protein